MALAKLFKKDEELKSMESKLYDIIETQREQELIILKFKAENEILKKRLSYLEFQQAKHNYLNFHFKENSLKDELESLKLEIKNLKKYET